MQSIRARAWLVVAMLVMPPLAAIAAPTKEESRIIAATAILDQWQQMPDLAIPDRLLERAQGIAIFPSVIKGAVIFGGRLGRGVVMVRDAKGEWSNPAFLTLAGGNFGFQFGVEAADVIMVFTTRRGIEGLSGGKVTIGVDLAGAVGPVGRHMSGATDLGFSAEVYSYSRAQGLFAGVAVDGTSMSVDHGANARFYGQDGLLASEIFAGKTRSPASATALVGAVDRLVRSGMPATAASPAATDAPSNTASRGTPANPRPDDKGLESGGATTFPLDPPR
jgi:lipid-binding SYLF domain-containing protein